MVRFFSWLVGAGFVGALLFALVSSISGLITEPPQPTVTEEFHKEPKPLSLASDGPFGKYDNQQLQRGFQVYKEVCAACHSIDLVHFRDLEGIGYNKAEVKAIAAQWVIERSEEHTSELQSLMRISYAVFCSKQKTHIKPLSHS